MAAGVRSADDDGGADNDACNARPYERYRCPDYSSHSASDHCGINRNTRRQRNGGPQRYNGLCKHNYNCDDPSDHVEHHHDASDDDNSRNNDNDNNDYVCAANPRANANRDDSDNSWPYHNGATDDVAAGRDASPAGAAAPPAL